MDIKRKTCEIWTWKKHFFHTLVPSLYQCVETRRAEVFWLLSQPLPYLRFHLFISETFATQLWTVLRDKHFPLQTGNISLWISFALGLFGHKTETHNRTLLFGSTQLKHGRNFDYWNQPLNTRMRLGYLDCHEGGLCCYLVIHIENLLRSLQLFYLHLWPIHWLSLVR
jgi:hypothetical protein